MHIHKYQIPEYAQDNWEFKAEDEDIMVLHTLTVLPKLKGQKFGDRFLKFYEEFSREHGCKYLRMDTNVLNVPANFTFQNTFLNLAVFWTLTLISFLYFKIRYKKEKIS